MDAAGRMELESTACETILVAGNPADSTELPARYAGPGKIDFDQRETTGEK
jgi:hypothetical protein